MTEENIVIENEEKTAMRYDEAPLRPELLRAVRELGYEYMTPIQEQAIPVLLEGGDVIGQAQTGTGKTAAFGLPILQKIDPSNKNVQAIVLCPTRELAVQAAEDMRAFAKYLEGVKVLPVYGGQDIMRQIKALKGVQVVIGTPGRVMDHMRRHTVKMDKIRVAVLDEADEMLDMGFREDMEVILGQIEHEHQTCMFSATMPQPILELTGKYQKDPTMVKITGKELTIDLVKQYYYPIRKEYKEQALLRLLAYYQFKRCLIFCNTKLMVDTLSSLLQREGYSAEGLHGDLAQNQRDSAMGRFKGGALDILIATDIAARGIDVDQVEAVINYDIPQEIEHYVHRIGRTGRAGHEGISLTLCAGRELKKLHEIERVCHTKMEERSIPSSESITDHQVRGAMDKAMQVLKDGHSGKYIPVIRSYCEEMEISVEALAAAFLKQQLGEEMEDLPISLPPKEKKPGRAFGRRENGGRREGSGKRWEDRERQGRRDRGAKWESGQEKDRRFDKKFGKDREEMRSGEGRGFKGRRGDKAEAAKTHAQNKKQSRHVLEKALTDIRMNGKPFVKKKGGHRS